MHVSLTPELEQIIKSKVESGFYNNASEVIRDALRFMQTNYDLVHQMKLNHLRNHLAIGENEIANSDGQIIKSKDDIADLFSNIKK